MKVQDFNLSSSFKISAVIPVKNGYPEIICCVESLLKQTIVLERILVIDSGSTDGTLDYLRTVPKVQIIQILPDEFNHGLTRNLGFKDAVEDYLFYTVQDAEAKDERLLENLIAGFLDEEVAGVCGKQVVPHDLTKNPYDWYFPISKPNIERIQLKGTNNLTPREFRQYCGWDNVCAIYRVEILKKFPFEKLVFGEDMSWAKKVLLNGKSVVYNGNAIVFHYHNEIPSYTFKRSFTTFYFRYIHFGDLPTMPKNDWLYFLKLLVVLGKRTGFNLKLIHKWFLYNLRRIRATSEAISIFNQTLLISEKELELLHNNICGLPPTPIKN